MSRDGLNAPLARRWFWTLLVIAIMSMGWLYRALTSGHGVTAGVGVLVSSIVVIAAIAQAARIRLALSGGPACRGLHADKVRGKT